MLNKMKAVSTVGSILLSSLALAQGDEIDRDAMIKVPQNCLIKSGAIGQPETDSQRFDLTDFVTKNLPTGYTPYEYRYCIASDNNLSSLQLVYADADAKDFIFLPAAGPETSNCVNQKFDSRGAADLVRIFRTSAKITGLGILYENPYTPILKFGLPTRDSLDTDFEDDNLLAGFYGAANTSAINELGIIILDSACSAKFAEEQAKVNEQNALDSIIGEVEGSSSAVIIIVVVLVVLLLIAAAVIFGYLFLRRKSQTTVRVINLDGKKGGKDSKRVMPSANTSQSMPNVETDDADPYPATGRGSGRGFTNKEVNVSKEFFHK